MLLCLDVLLQCLTCGYVASEGEFYSPGIDELQCPVCLGYDLTDSNIED